MKNLSVLSLRRPVQTIRVSAAVIALSFCLATRSAAQDKKYPVIRTVDGATIFRNYCASCHGADGKGHGPVAPALRVNLPDLTRLTRAGGEFPTARVRKIIEGEQNPAAHGSREMPVWGPVFHQIDVDQDLGNVRIDNLTKYIESIQRK